jgi:hypothetical protein
MDPLVLLVAFASFLGGLLVTSRVIAWLIGLALFFKPSTTSGASLRFGLIVALFLLHSGPWVLAVAVAGVFYAASSSHPAYLWAVGGGLALALSLIGVATLRAFLHQRRPKSEPPPLTPERLIVLRRRFFWRYSLLFALVGTISSAFGLPLSFSKDFGFFLFIFIASLLVGWGWSWFMWQYYGAILQVNENRRKKERERKNAV